MSLPLWTWSEVAAALGLPIPAREVALHGVATDSRAVKPGDLFIGLRGSTSDGATYLPQAKANGAAAAIVSHAVPEVDLPQLIAADPRLALQQLARAARARLSVPVVGVGGSVGKTTTTAMLVALLEAHGPEGSLNNHVGVPLTLARTPRHAKALVAEIGTNAPGEVGPLSALVQPDVALLTNIEAEHLEGLGDLEGVRREELSIISGLNPTGTLVLPQGIDLSGCGWAGRVLRFDPTKPLPFTLPEPTPARVACANAAQAVLHALGRSMDEAALTRLAAVRPGPGRGQVLQVGEVTLIDDSYNANPASMAAALVALQARPATRRIAVLGDMKELGPAGPEYHRALAPQLAELEGVVLLGPLMQELTDLLPAAQLWATHTDPETFEPAALAARLQPGDVVLVKGSKSVTYVRQHASRLAAALQPTA